MIGHTQLIALRRRGVKPTAVYITDMVHQLARDWHDPRSLSGVRFNAMHDPHISIEPTDKIRHLDFRFLVGLDVRVSSDDEAVARELFRACIDAGAQQVVGCHTKPGAMLNDQSVWIEIFNKDENNG